MRKQKVRLEIPKLKVREVREVREKSSDSTNKAYQIRIPTEASQEHVDKKSRQVIKKFKLL